MITTVALIDETYDAKHSLPCKVNERFDACYMNRTMLNRLEVTLGDYLHALDMSPCPLT